MKLSEFKHTLSTLNELHFILPNGAKIPSHFHITEVGQVVKNFIDCGGTVRNETLVSMQLWESIDVWHRLEPKKLLDIIDLSISKLGLIDEEIEIEYQADTIGKYGVKFEENIFKLTPKKTDCLAQDKCGIPIEKSNTGCTPGGGCC